MQKIIPLIIIVILLPSFFFGVIVGHYQIPPFEVLSNIKQTITDNPDESNTKRLQIYQDISEIDDLIQINNPQDIETKKSLLVDYLWLGDGFPSDIYPKTKLMNVVDPLFSDIDSLERIDTFTVLMDYEMTSISYLFIPKISNDELIIFHQGHGSSSLRGPESHSFEQDKDIIRKLLDENYSVLIFSMIGHGMNNEPTIDHPRFGKIHLNTHDHLRFIESDDLHPLKFFVEPVIITLNQIENDYTFKKFNMIGISGGGWTTVIVSSIDDRITESYSVAGTFPLWLRSDPDNLGDYEQIVPEFYELATYEELYLMSSFGEERKLFLIYNEFDPCCMPGWLYDKFPFGTTISSKLDLLGQGEFDVIIDRGQEKHIISEKTLTRIINQMKS